MRWVEGALYQWVTHFENIFCSSGLCLSKQYISRLAVMQKCVLLVADSVPAVCAHWVHVLESIFWSERCLKLVNCRVGSFTLKRTFVGPRQTDRWSYEVPPFHLTGPPPPNAGATHLQTLGHKRISKHRIFEEKWRPDLNWDNTKWKLFFLWEIVLFHHSKSLSVVTPPPHRCRLPNPHRGEGCYFA